MNQKTNDVSDEDERFIINLVGTFRMSAPIMLDDIRFAAQIEGHPIDKINGTTLSSIVAKRCDVIVYAGDHPKSYHKYVRRW